MIFIGLILFVIAIAGTLVESYDRSRRQGEAYWDEIHNCWSIHKPVYINWSGRGPVLPINKNR